MDNLEVMVRENACQRKDVANIVIDDQHSSASKEVISTPGSFQFLSLLFTEVLLISVQQDNGLIQQAVKVRRVTNGAGLQQGTDLVQPLIIVLAVEDNRRCEGCDASLDVGDHGHRRLARECKIDDDAVHILIREDPDGFIRLVSS